VRSKDGAPDDLDDARVIHDSLYTRQMPRIQDNSLQLSISHAITRLFREQNRFFGRAVERHGISTEQGHLLVVLFTRGPLTMTELGREVALSSGTLSAAVDRMEASGLVRRRADPSDRRSVRVEPTWPEAKRKALMTTLLEAEDEFLAPLSAKERPVLLRLLERMLQGSEALPRVESR
jgi:MarR family 2-MHQ and catechol resistance regulon transcriptional repressor